MKKRVFTLFVCLGLTMIFSGVFAFAETVEPTAAAVPTADQEPSYYYMLYCTNAGEEDGILELQLHVFDHGTGLPNLDGGSFGLRFPARLESAFNGFMPATSNIDVTPMIPKERAVVSGEEIISESYHAFSWTNKTQYRFTTKEPAGIRMLLGTYQFELEPEDTLPAKSSIGQLDWLKAVEANPTEMPGQKPEDNPFNRDIWNPQTKNYQGYYQVSDRGDPEDLTLKQTDISFKWEPPSSWPNAFTILSYDPKKQMTAELYEVKNASGSAVNRKVGDTVYLDRWTSAESEKEGKITAATLNNKGSGIGPYFQALNLEDFGTKSGESLTPAALNPGSTYRLLLQKPGHLSVSVGPLLATSEKLSEAENLPESEVYLPCGDINPVDTEAGTVFGDGAIKLLDRAFLLAFLNGETAVQDPELTDRSTASYLADLDGDGAVTLKDLSILMSPENFNNVNSGGGKGGKE